jgi:hypothetical protein
MSKQIKDYPKWVQEIVIKRQIEQGNEPNIELYLTSSQKDGNFYWQDTKEELVIWNKADNGNLQPLADFHGIKIDENGEEVREMPIISQDGEKTKSYEPCYLPKISGFIEDICSYIENAEILMPIEELVDENYNVVTRRQYGEVLIKYLVIDIRENFHNHIQNKVK